MAKNDMFKMMRVVVSLVYNYRFYAAVFAEKRDLSRNLV